MGSSGGELAPFKFAQRLTWLASAFRRFGLLIQRRVADFLSQLVTRRMGVVKQHPLANISDVRRFLLV
jgi:hypothetical protein